MKIFLYLLILTCSSIALTGFSQEITYEVDSTSRFSFYSNPWINLHHLLYHWARSESELPERQRRRLVEVAEKSAFANLSPHEQAAWRSALDYYIQELATRSHFDSLMRVAHHQLGMIDSGENNRFNALPAGMVKALKSAMPVYQTHWWKDHDSANRDWIAKVIPKLEKFEGAIAKKLADAYGSQWPEKAFRVDVSAYTNRQGAYTYTQAGEAHITISSTHPNYQDYYALEMLFHESSHTQLLWPLIQSWLGIYQARGEEPPPTDEDHVLIFYTAGELTRRTLAEHGVDDYLPYGDRFGVYQRGRNWEEYREVIGKHWQLFLDGKIDRLTALERIVEDL